jgi:glycolate dehydrogenase FAD-linked subunit
MNRILEINHGNLTAQVECGVVLADFHRAVEKEGLFYPPDPQSMTVCTLGGNVATRAGGPHGVKYGTTGNYVLGLEVVLPDGAIIQTGSSCVKHSVGYDLTHLMTGSEGTLGVITKVTVRLLPKPEVDRTVIIVCESIKQAVETVSEIIARKIVPAKLEYVPRGAISGMNRYITPPLEIEGGAYLFVMIDGSPSQIQEESEKIKNLCQNSGVLSVKVIEEAEEAASYWKARTAAYPLLLAMVKKVIIEDVAVPRDQIASFAESLEKIAAETGIPIGMSGHAGDGNVHPSVFLAGLLETHVARNGIEVTIPEGLACCGIPALAEGDIETARRMMETNLHSGWQCCRCYPDRLYLMRSDLQ